jgi:hypothetical protein
MVARKGLKISLAEVDAVAGSLPGVEEVAVYAVPDEETGERLAMALHVQDRSAPISSMTLASDSSQNGLIQTFRFSTSSGCVGNSLGIFFHASSRFLASRPAQLPPFSTLMSRTPGKRPSMPWQIADAGVSWMVRPPSAT